MKVYRIENSSGLGPYQGSDDYREAWANSNHNHQENTPKPSLEGIPFSYELFFGFRDKQQIKGWFTPEELIKISKLGFTLNLYEAHISNTHSTKTQVAFRVKLATKLETLDIIEFINND